MTEIEFGNCRFLKMFSNISEESEQVLIKCKLILLMQKFWTIKV